MGLEARKMLIKMKCHSLALGEEKKQKQKVCANEKITVRLIKSFF